MLVALLASALLWAPVHSLEVTNTSDCAGVCGDGASETSQLMCHDALYDATEIGRETRDCLLCLSTSSEYQTPVENDVYWFLFHQKFTIQYCLFNEPGKTSAMPDCETECRPLRPVFLRLWHQDDGLVPLYDYCGLNGGALGTYIDDCGPCVRKHEGSIVAANFLTNLNTACELRPNASDGELLSLAQPLFATSTSSPPSATPSSAEQPGETEETGSSGLSTGASAGIGVGVAAAVIIVVVLLIWLRLRRKRKARATQPSPEPIKQDYSPQDRLAFAPVNEADDSSMVTDGRTQTGGAWRTELSTT